MECGPECPLWRVSCGSWMAVNGICTVSTQSLLDKAEIVKKYHLTVLVDLYRAAIAARRAAEANAEGEGERA